MLKFYKKKHRKKNYVEYHKNVDIYKAFIQSYVASNVYYSLTAETLKIFQTNSQKYPKLF